MIRKINEVWISHSRSSDEPEYYCSYINEDGELCKARITETSYNEYKSQLNTHNEE